MNVKFALIVLALLFASGESAKILCLFTTFIKPHLDVYLAIANVLVERGHNLTVVTTLPVGDIKSKYRHIPVQPAPFPEEFRTTSQNIHFLKRMKLVADYSLVNANATIFDPKMQKLMREESFDLMILGYFFNDLQIGVAAHFKCPYVIAVSQRPPRLVDGMIGNPLEPMYVPHLFFGENLHLGFFGRMKNILAYVADYIVFQVFDYKQRMYYESIFPATKYPTFYEMRENVSLVLSNQYITDGTIAPKVPAFIQIGGIKIKPEPDPLPQDIRKFLDGASEHGAIYFSLGVIAQSIDLDAKVANIIFKALSSLKQRVIWKWEDDKYPGNATNILYKTWLPQEDILAHPNMRLFITHGGHGSIMEAEYYGVPMVGIPLYGDQFSNMEAVFKAGYGLIVRGKDIMQEKLKDIILEALATPVYRENVQAYSKLYRDRPMNARQTAAFWIEYVIRHKGAAHIQSPAVRMNLVEYLGLDVLAFLLTVIYISLKIICFVFRKAKSLICTRKSKTNKKVDVKKKRD